MLAPFNLIVRASEDNKMSNEITKTIDPFVASAENLLVVTFQKSTSKSYPLAVNIAQGAQDYTEANIGGKLVHFVIFGKNRAEAGRAQALINYISGWKGIQVFAGGKMIQNPWSIMQVLNCFLEASGCNDWKAHCLKIIDDPYNTRPASRGMSFTIRITEKPEMPKQAVEIKQYTFPCAYLKNRFKFQLQHPSSPENQIQAGAISEGCDWCPYFKTESYEIVGTKTEYHEFFE